MEKDRPMLGILLMLGFCIIAPIGDAVAKLIGQTVATGPMLLVRFTVQVILLAPFVLWFTKLPSLGPRMLGIIFARTLLHIAAIALMFTALRYMPLADAIAIVFVLPFLNLTLGWLLLEEETGPRRFLACVIGFLGTLLVIEPSFTILGWVALLPFSAALCFSIFMLVTRHISADIDPFGLQTVSGLMAIALIIPALLMGPQLASTELTWVPLNTREWTLVLSIGALGTLAHLLMTWSLRYAPSATVSPMQYIEIPIAAIIGFYVFAEIPSSRATLGICLTMASGLYILLTEKVSAPKPVPEPEPEPAEPKLTAAE